MCNNFGPNLSEAPGNAVSLCQKLVAAERKLESILQCKNGITVVNKAGIRAPPVAFGEDPSLFPFKVGHHHLKKRTSFSSPLCVHTSAEQST